MFCPCLFVCRVHILTQTLLVFCPIIIIDDVNNQKEEQCQKDLTQLQTKQEDLWQTLLTKADAQKCRVEELWHKVELAEQAVDKERGYDKFNSSWGKFRFLIMS